MRLTRSQAQKAKLLPVTPAPPAAEEMQVQSGLLEKRKLSVE
jgi:hypothetical protein